MQDKEDLCKIMGLLDILRCLELVRASSDLDIEMTYKQTHALLKVKGRNDGKNLFGEIHLHCDILMILRRSFCPVVVLWL